METERAEKRQMLKEQLEQQELRLRDAEKNGVLEEQLEQQEWRLRDSEKRGILEEQVEQISHLFNDESEEDSGRELFTLPSRLSRLECSSSSSTDLEQSHIRTQSATPCGPPHTSMTCRNTELRGSQGNAVALYKTPGRIDLHGPLAKTTDGILYWKIKNELRCYQNKHPSSNIHFYLDKRFELSRKDDTAVMLHIQGTRAARYMTGGTQQALTRCKQLKLNMHTYHLKYPAIAEAHVYWNMYVYYMAKGMAGSAHSALQAAVSCMQHHAPSAWRALVCELQGCMFDRLAQVRPRHKIKYQDEALRCFTNAREHYLYQPCQEEENYLYLPLYYTLQLVLIKLDMPTQNTINDFPDSEIVYQRLSECVVRQCQVTEAQHLLTAMTPHLNSLSAGGKAGIMERVLICKIIVHIRLTQLAISDKAYNSGLSFINTAEDLYDEWCDYPFKYTDTDFKDYPNLPWDIKRTVVNLKERLTITFPPDPQEEPFSDTVSSEPSDVPPSGLKKLTEESRRAEKQARRDANQFSYSSGDIYTDSEADVPSEVS